MDAFKRGLIVVTVALGCLSVLEIATLAGSPEVFFRDRAGESGVSFRLENSPTDQMFLIETMTGGCAFLDYDGDGLLDIFLVNGAAIRLEPGKRPRIDKS